MLPLFHQQHFSQSCCLVTHFTEHYICLVKAHWLARELASKLNELPIVWWCKKKKQPKKTIFICTYSTFTITFFRFCTTHPKSDDTLNLVRAHTSRTHTHTRTHSLFLLSSACLIPITEVCREGPCDWLTGYPEDKQVYVLACMYQGWIRLKTETEGKRARTNRRSNWENVIETQTHWNYCMLQQ